MIAELEGVFRREFSLGDVEGGIHSHANVGGALDDPYGSGTGAGGQGNTGWGARDYLDF